MLKENGTLKLNMDEGNAVWRVGDKDETRESILASMEEVLEKKRCSYCGGDCEFKDISLERITIHKLLPNEAEDLHVPEFEGWGLHSYRIICRKCRGILENIQDGEKVIFPDHGSFLYDFLQGM